MRVIKEVAKLMTRRQQTQLALRITHKFFGTQKCLFAVWVTQTEATDVVAMNDVSRSLDQEKFICV